MARRNGYEEERNPLKMVLYIIAVLAMLGCIGYLIYSSRLGKQEYQENVRRAAAGETELVIEERETESETEQTTESETAQKNAAAAQNNTTAAQNNTNTSEIASESEPESESENESEGESESETNTEAVSAMSNNTGKDMSVLVLNGTGVPGVAGYWKSQLEEAGYSNVTPATYTQTVGEDTVIYAATNREAELFKEQFPDAEIEIGTVDTGLEAAEGIPLPEECDVYIIIGKKDARSE